MRIVITGGLGFVGHALTCQLLAGGHQPVVLTSRPATGSSLTGVEVVHANTRDRDVLTRTMRAVNPDGVCHLAALTRVRDSFSAPLAYYDVNVGGTAALLHALEDLAPLPVVFASTGAVYGVCEGRIAEHQPTLPTNPYGASKLAAEQLLAYHAETGAIAAVTLRCFNISGAADGIGDGDTTRIIPKALAVAAGRAETLGINGDGAAVREFTHVLDVADAMVLALGAAQPGNALVYNLGSGIETTMLDVVREVERVTGRRLPVEHNPPRPEPKVMMADSTRIHEELAWTPTRSSIERIIADAWAAAAPNS